LNLEDGKAFQDLFASCVPEPKMTSGAQSRLPYDEYDINFEYVPPKLDRYSGSRHANLECRDTSAFAVERYNDILEAIKEQLEPNDLRTIQESRDCQTIQDMLRRRSSNPELGLPTRRLINQYRPLPWTINDLAMHFQHLVRPSEPEMELLWGLIYINIEVCLSSAT
jgi:hypothetical protein